jgi:hypothetical protein
MSTCFLYFYGNFIYFTLRLKLFTKLYRTCFSNISDNMNILLYD